MSLESGSYCQASEAVSDGRETRSEVSLVYMVTGADKNADTHLFVMSNLWRAEGRRREVTTKMIDVKTN